jgi:hypothetical protein
MHAKPGYNAFAACSQHRVVPELLAFVYVRDMHLDGWSFNSRNSIGNGNRSVGISTGIQHNAIIAKANFVQFVYNFALNITLVIINGDVCKMFCNSAR